MGLIIKKLGDNYVNVNSRDKREGEREREAAFWVGWHKKKDRQKDMAKRQTKKCQKHQQSQKFITVYIKKFISKSLNKKSILKSLHEKVYIKQFILKFIKIYIGMKHCLYIHQDNILWIGPFCATLYAKCYFSRDLVECISCVLFNWQHL